MNSKNNKQSNPISRNKYSSVKKNSIKKQAKSKHDIKNVKSKPNNVDNQEKTKIIYVKETLQQAIERVRKEEIQKKLILKNQLMQNHSQVSKFSNTSKNQHKQSKIVQNQLNLQKKQVPNNNVIHFQQMPQKNGQAHEQKHFNKQVQIQVLLQKINQQKQANQVEKVKKDQLLIRRQQKNQLGKIQNSVNNKGQQQKKHEQNPQQVRKILQNHENKELLNLNPVLHQKFLSIKKSNKTEFSNNKITTKSCRSFATSHQKLTKTMAQRLQEKQREAKQKIMKIKVNLLQSQTKFKLQKKIKQNLQLVQKKQLLSQFFHSKLEWQKQRDQNLRKKRQEERLLHESNQMKIQMLKKLKKRTKKSELQLCRSKSQQSLLNLQFTKTLKEKEKQQKKQILVERYRFLKNKNKSLMNFRTEKHTENNLNSVRTQRRTFMIQKNMTARQKY